MNGLKNVVYTHNWILSSLKKEGISAICHYIDKPEGHYAKGNKPVTEEQILYDSPFEVCKIVQLIEVKNRIVFARVWGQG